MSHHRLTERGLIPSCLDLVVSSLALHYVADYSGFVQRAAQWLRSGGYLIYSIEHPVCTAQDPMTGWIDDRGGRTWPINAYARETSRAQEWFGVPITKYHRRVSTLLRGITDAGLVLDEIDEPHPGQDVISRRPELAQHLRRPPLLLVKARKP